MKDLIKRFQEIGYKKTSENQDYIQFTKKNHLSILFNLNTKSVVHNFLSLEQALNMKEVQIIYDTCKYLKFDGEDIYIPHKYLIKQEQDLGLCYKTYINKKAEPDEIEICKFNSDGTRYTIASFDYDEDEECYCLNSCCDRLKIDINWTIFGSLVKQGYEMLKEVDK